MAQVTVQIIDPVALFMSIQAYHKREEEKKALYEAISGSIENGLYGFSPGKLNDEGEFYRFINHNFRRYVIMV